MSPLPYLLLLAGFFLLVKGADYLVQGGSRLAAVAGFSPLFVGLGIAALGTSAPEAAVSVKAALTGHSDISVGNIVGSNVANLGLALGLASLVHRLHCSASTLWKEIPYSFLAAAALLLMGMTLPGGSLLVARWEGLTLLVLYAGYLYYLFAMASSDRRKAFLDGHIESLRESRGMVLRASLVTVGGIAAVVVGGHVVVDNASAIALAWGISETLISVTVVALGTSLPEVATTLVAVHRGEYDMALGNVVGSNIFNILLVLGATAAIRPVAFNPGIAVDLLVVLGATLLLFLYLLRGRRLRRWQGASLLLVYAAYVTYAICRR